MGAIVKRLLPAAILLLAGLSCILYVYGEKPHMTISLVGDILLDRGVERVMAQKGALYPYLGTMDVLKRADITFGNLECPITWVNAPLLKNRNIVFRADPGNAACLKEAGFDLLSLANNHTMDQGIGGLDETMKLLDKEHISTLGAGCSSEEARKPVYFNRQGTNIGFLGFSDFPPEGYFYSADECTVAHADRKTIADAVKRAKSKCDVLIVSFHWGKEFDYFAGESQKELAHIAIDSGADIVAGHHPHVLQGIEKYKGGFIFYSLGNFIFDRQIQAGTDQSVIISLKLSKSKVDGIEIIPLKIVNCQPVIAGKTDGEYILNRLALYSGDMGVSFKDSTGSWRINMQ